MIVDATVNLVVYKGDESVFIDTEYDTWNMDQVAQEKVFDICLYVYIFVVAHLYGVLGEINEIRIICEKKHKSLIVEDTAESFRATYKGMQIGIFGTESIISFNCNNVFKMKSEFTRLIQLS